MNSFRIQTNIIACSLACVAVACGEPTAEETAEESAAAVTSVVAALSTTTEMGANAAEAQSEGLEEPTAPGGDDVSCVTTELVNGRLRIDYGTGCEINGHVFAGVYSIGLSLFRGFGVVLEYENFRKDDILHNGELALQISSPESAVNIALLVEEGATTRDLGLSGRLVTISDTSSELDATGHYDEGTGRSAFSASGLLLRRGECYPRAGSVTIELPEHPPAEVRFSERTPVTGEVQVVVGERSIPTTLRMCP